jgi:S1-C subfamily serine protease
MTDLSSAQAALDAYSQAIQAVVNAVSPAVVRVQALKDGSGRGPGRHRGGHRKLQGGPWRHPGGPWRHPGDHWKQAEQHWKHGRARTNHGSGVIIDAEAGYILTNFHVTRSAERVRVHLHDRTALNGKIIGADADTDIAVVQVEAEDLTAARWGDAGALSVGSTVIALGNPDGDTIVATNGIVSALQRQLRGPSGRMLEDLIQTTAIFNPGMSGGPLVNSAGEVIGINTASVVEAQGLNLAISSTIARKLAQDLLSYGEIRRPRLGVAGERQRIYGGLIRHHDLKQSHGVFIHDVKAGTPAATAGLTKSDILISAADQVVEGLDDLHRILTGKQYGDTMKVRVLRDLELVELTVTLTAPDAESA